VARIEANQRWAGCHLQSCHRTKDFIHNRYQVSAADFRKHEITGPLVCSKHNSWPEPAEIQHPGSRSSPHIRGTESHQDEAAAASARLRLISLVRALRSSLALAMLFWHVVDLHDHGANLANGLDRALGIGLDARFLFRQVGSQRRIGTGRKQASS
jgi:hypothetical protein